VAEDSAAIQVDPHLVSRIVGNYVKHHKLGAEQLGGLIADVHRALGGLIADVHRALGGLGSVAPPEEPPAPAVPIRRSVRPDYVVCLDCGFRAKMLRRHIRQVHGLEPAAYRAHWHLPADHPLTAPSYAAQRSAFAKEIGLGQRQRTIGAPPPAAATPEPLDPVFAASLSPHPRRTRKPRSAPAA
jgi:predicted transcriptional regulator